MNNEFDPATPVYWIGGSSCAGKSSAAARIAEQCGLLLYRTDETAFGKHMFGLETPDRYPAIARYRDLLCSGMDAFYEHPLAELRDYFLGYCREVFPLLLEDIAIRSRERPVIVEGAHVLPELVPSNADRNTIFLVSSPEQQARIWRMEMSGEIPGGHPGEIENYRKADNKNQIEQWRTGFHNMLALYIEESAHRHSFPVISVDTKITHDSVISAILDQFQLK